MDQKNPSHLPTEVAPEKSAYAQHDPDLDAIWRLAVGLDLGTRSVFEAEVLIWRICIAKSMPQQSIERALNDEWEK